MFEPTDFYRWRCVRTVIDVAEHVPRRWLARRPMVLDETSVGLLLLWSWLRFESDFLTRCLESLGVDLTAFTHEVDKLLNDCNLPKEYLQTAEWSLEKRPKLSQLRSFTACWLERALTEAEQLHQNYTGMEHLLLAFLRDAESPIASLFFRYGIDRPRLENAVLEAIKRKHAEEPTAAQAGYSLAEVVPEDTGSMSDIWPAWLPPAVGMPKRFTMATMMLWVTLFAIAFSVLSMIDGYLGHYGHYAHPEYYVIVAVLMFAVGIGQMWLFGGRHPRAASVCTGAVTLPIVCIFVDLTMGFTSSDSRPVGFQGHLLNCFLSIFLGIPLGAFFGYLLGGLTAGIVLMLENLEKRRAHKQASKPDDADNIAGETIVNSQSSNALGKTSRLNS
jgi:hypothetical protein